MAETNTKTGGLGGLAGLGGFNIPGFTGGDSGPAVSGAEGLFSGRNMIDIAPVGVNVGEILRNYENPTPNGEYSISRASRYFGASLVPTVQAGSAGSILPLIIIGGIGFLIYMAVKR